jgi:TolB-like protein/DNA-binding winged helix-turn-helix (wHTH) protein/Flp pilus assembly protein TadD
VKSQWGFHGIFVKSGITGVKTPQLTDNSKLTGYEEVEQARAMKSFKAFRLDTANHLLWCNGERVPVAPKGFDVLAYLVEHAGQVVTPDEILEALWPETYVNPEVLRKYIQEIRKALVDRPDKPEFIETLPKRGYRFIAPVTDESTAEPDSPTALPTEEHATEQTVRAETPPLEQEGFLPKRTVWKLGIVLVLAMVVAAAMGIYFRPSRSRANARSLNDTSIAVLPFADMSPAKDQEYFSDGLAEQLINDLAKVSGIKVVGRSSAFQFNGQNEDLRDVGRKLGVANILEGSVRKEGGRVRITIALTKVDDGFQLWTETYDREINHIFAAQDEIARAVTAALKVELLTPSNLEHSPNSRTNPEAYRAYLQGQYFIARGQDKQDLDKALSYADQAIKLDANYAPAWAQRSLVLRTMASIAVIENPDEVFYRARESAQKAIALDPNLAAGYLAMAMVQINPDWDWEGADASLQRAGLLEPGSADVLRARAHLARVLGRVDEAIGLYKQAIALDPLKANFHLALAYELYIAGRYEEARDPLQSAADLNPQLSSLHLTWGQILLSEGRPTEALAAMEKETGEWEKLSGEPLAYYALGRREESEGALQKLIATHQHDAAYQIAEVYAYRGETDKAFEWLNRAYQQRDPGTPELQTDRLMRRIRQDPRYAELLKRMHLPI